jgi:1,4-dihydroxy-2-naphthoyl-CoA synthase
VLNAVNETMGKELLDALGNAERDDDVHCLIITGNGRAFCAGEDIQDLRGQYERGENPKLGARLLHKYNPIVRQIRRMQKPVIAASITAHLILTGDLRKTGVAAPESYISTSRYLNELGEREIKMTKSEIYL